MGCGSGRPGLAQETHGALTEGRLQALEIESRVAGAVPSLRGTSGAPGLPLSSGDGHRLYVRALQGDLSQNFVLKAPVCMFPSCSESIKWWDRLDSKTLPVSPGLAECGPWYPNCKEKRKCLINSVAGGRPAGAVGGVCDS